MVRVVVLDANRLSFNRRWKAGWEEGGGMREAGTPESGTDDDNNKHK